MSTHSLYIYWQSGDAGLSLPLCIFQFCLRHKQQVAGPSICVSCLLSWAVCSIFSPKELRALCCVCVPVCVHPCVFTVHVLPHCHQAHFTNALRSFLLRKQAQRCDKVNLAPLVLVQRGWGGGNVTKM